MPIILKAFGIALAGAMLVVFFCDAMNFFDGFGTQTLFYTGILLARRSAQPFPEMVATMVYFAPFCIGLIMAFLPEREG